MRKGVEERCYEWIEKREEKCDLPLGTDSNHFIQFCIVFIVGRRSLWNGRMAPANASCMSSCIFIPLSISLLWYPLLLLYSHLLNLHTNLSYGNCTHLFSLSLSLSLSFFLSPSLSRYPTRGYIHAMNQTEVCFAPYAYMHTQIKLNHTLIECSDRLFLPFCSLSLLLLTNTHTHTHTHTHTQPLPYLTAVDSSPRCNAHAYFDFATNQGEVQYQEFSGKDRAQYCSRWRGVKHAHLSSVCASVHHYILLRRSLFTLVMNV